MDLTPFARRLREKKISQAELTRLLGGLVTHQFIQNLCAGRRYATLGVAMLIEHATEGRVPITTVPLREREQEIARRLGIEGFDVRKG